MTEVTTMAANATAYDDLKGEPAVMLSIAAGKSYRQAAQEAGVHVRTINRRMESDDYRRRVSQARSEMIDRAAGQLADSTTAAVATLVALLAAESEQTRLGAARSILDTAGRYRELVELNNRVAELESRLANGKVRTIT